MREIKFRAWDTQLETYSYSGWGSRTFGIFVKRTNCGRYIIEEYTGKTDRDGKDVCENDIVKFNSHGGINCGEKFIGKIIYRKCNYCITDKKENMYFWLGSVTIENMEVIGNINENPELLEQNNDIS